MFTHNELFEIARNNDISYVLTGEPDMRKIQRTMYQQKIEMKYPDLFYEEVDGIKVLLRENDDSVEFAMVHTTNMLFRKKLHKKYKKTLLGQYSLDTMIGRYGKKINPLINTPHGLYFNATPGVSMSVLPDSTIDKHLPIEEQIDEALKYVGYAATVEVAKVIGRHKHG